MLCYTALLSTVFRGMRGGVVKRAIGILLACSLGIGLGQGVRSLGMGGVIVPGPAAGAYNPAYIAFPAKVYGYPGGIQLPLGLVGLLLPGRNPFNYSSNLSTFKSQFDLLSFYDQVTHLGSFLFNPARSPDKVMFDISQKGLNITDGSGQPIKFGTAGGSGSVGTGASTLTPPPLLSVPIPAGPVQLRVGIFAGSEGISLSPGGTLQAALTTGKFEPNTWYDIDTNLSAQAGIDLSTTYATPVPIPGLKGTLYLGGRVEAFYGLAYLSAQLKAQASFDQQNKVSTQYQGKAFYVYPGKGRGYGARADLGAALSYRGGTYGLSVLNAFGFSHWQGAEETYASNSTSTPIPASRNFSGFEPAIFLNAAYPFKLQSGRLLWATDLVYARDISAHTGVEYRLGHVYLRSGLGWNGRLSVGLGAGYSTGGVTFDTALTTHQAPFVGGIVYGLAASLGFSL